MRKLLAILLMSAGLIVTTTAAFAQDGASFDGPAAFFVFDQSAVPFAWWWSWWWADVPA